MAQDTPKNDLLDLVSLLCTKEKEARFSPNPSLWFDCKDSQAERSELDLLENNLNTDESISLSTFAKKHFLTNDARNERENKESNFNTVKSLASYFEDACTQQEDETDCEPSHAKNSPDIEKNKTLSELFSELETAKVSSYFQATCSHEDEVDSGNNISQDSHDSENCTKTLSDLFSKLETPEESNVFEVNLEMCLKSEVQHRKRSKTFIEADLTSTEINIGKIKSSSSLKSKFIISNIERNTIVLKPLYDANNILSLYDANISNSAKPKVKRSLFAQALSCKRKNDDFLKQKMSDIEVELGKRYLQLRYISSEHKKPWNNSIHENASSFDQTVICRRTYGLK